MEMTLRQRDTGALKPFTINLMVWQHLEGGKDPVTVWFDDGNSQFHITAEQADQLANMLGAMVNLANTGHDVLEQRQPA